MAQVLFVQIRLYLSLRILKNFFVCCPLWKSLTWQDVQSGTKTPLRAFKRNYAHKVHRYAAKRRAAKHLKEEEKISFHRKTMALFVVIYVHTRRNMFLRVRATADTIVKCSISIDLVKMRGSSFIDPNKSFDFWYDAESL